MADGRPDAFETGLAALQRREWGSAELAVWLQKRGFGPDSVEAAITRLVESGELDDGRFARRYAEDKRELSGWGAVRIRESLSSRGIAAPLVDAALEADSHGAQVERAGDLLIGRGRPLERESDRARALGFLTRRGYDYEIAHEAIRLAARGRKHVDP
jgi:regulatory protein